jgi:glycerol-3-phosphate dehydrogenase
MAEDTVNEVIKVGRLRDVSCATAALKIHGYSGNGTLDSGHMKVYGSDALRIRALASARPELDQRLHDAFPHIGAEVVWSVHHEMARTVEDVLARRMRILFLNARVAKEMAPVVARLMAAELGFDILWQQDQVKSFSTLADHYLPDPGKGVASPPVRSTVIQSSL